MSRSASLFTSKRPGARQTWWYRIGLAETVKKNGTSTSVAGGQYKMSFKYEIQKLNCTPYPVPGAICVQHTDFAWHGLFFLTEQVRRQKYGVDSSALRAYLPFQR